MTSDELQHRRVGRPSKGPRAQIAVRVPPELKRLYEERAAAMGIPTGSWITLMVNESLGIPVPESVRHDLDVARSRQRAQDEELPLLSA